MVKPEEIVSYARTWIGAKWKHQGRGNGKDRGIDCAGLLVRTAQHFDLPGEDLCGYRREPGTQFVDQINRFTFQTDVPVHGAIGIFSDTVQPCHTGIFAIDETGFISLIHSEAYPKGRCHEEGFEDSRPSLKSRLIAVRLFKGVDYVF